MARNGSGTYNPPTNSWNPAVNGVSATAVDWQSILNDLSAALTQSVSRDGQASMTGNLPMAGNKLTGLGAGVATGDSVRWEQLFDQGVEQDVASAATTDIGIVNSNFIRITGTTSITSFGTNYKGPRFVRFAGVLTLTHNATTLILPTGANITTAAGDRAIIAPVGNPASGWQVLAYQRADGTALANASIASNTITGRLSAGTGQSESLTGAQAISIINGTRVDVASASTVDLSSVAASSINITGTTTITAFTVITGRLLFVRFNASLTLTNNANIVTQSGANIVTQAGDTCMIRATAANVVEVLSYTRSRTRQTGQVVSSLNGDLATGSTITPWDDTIPQVTEGDQYYSLAITPQNASSTLEVEVVMNLTRSPVGQIVVAVFRDGAANAVAAAAITPQASGQPAQCVLKFLTAASSVSSTTFTVRAGPADAATITLNGSAGGRRLGGVHVSGIIIRELLP